MRQHDLRRRALATILAHERALATPESIADRRRDRVLENHRADALRIRVPDPAACEVLIVGDAEQAASGGVHVERREVGVRDRDEVRRRIEDRGEASARLLGLFPLRDVDVDAGHPARRSVCAPLDDLSAAEDPLPSALLRAAAILGFVGRRVAGDVLVDRVLDCRHVVRVQALVPRAACAPLHLPRLVAEHQLGGRAEVDVAGVDAPVPEPFVRALEREPQTLLALEERFLGRLALGDVPMDADKASRTGRLHRDSLNDGVQRTGLAVPSIKGSSPSHRPSRSALCARRRREWRRCRCPRGARANEQLPGVHASSRSAAGLQSMTRPSAPVRTTASLIVAKTSARCRGSSRRLALGAGMLRWAATPGWWSREGH